MENEVQKVKQILANIDTLLNKGFPLTREKERRGLCNLNTVISSCGTYRCLAGWCDTIPELNGKFGVAMDGLDSCFSGATIAENFGFNRREHMMVFGYANQGNLDEREKYVRNVLRPRWQSRLDELTKDETPFTDWFNKTIKQEPLTESAMKRTLANLGAYTMETK